MFDINNLQHYMNEIEVNINPNFYYFFGFFIIVFIIFFVIIQYRRLQIICFVFICLISYRLNGWFWYTTCDLLWIWSVPLSFTNMSTLTSIFLLLYDAVFFIIQRLIQDPDQHNKMQIQLYLLFRNHVLFQCYQNQIHQIGEW